MTLFSPAATWPLDEHKMFADSVSRFMDDALAPNIEHWAEQGHVDRSFWQAAGDAGVG
ncbi:MAG: acyl-CoA dehydrogenase family protein [Rhodobacteraceae bacterium]|nr:acyl-CoA dehydrogenase family protein [Paracoccaceae bacterium]